MLKLMTEGSTARQVLEMIEEQRAPIRAMEGPLAELRANGMFGEASPFSKEFQRTQQLMDQYRARFTLPKLDTVRTLTQQLAQDPLVDTMKRYALQSTTLQHAIRSMQTPWLDSQNALNSVKALAEIQGIGKVVAQMHTFSEEVSNALRVDLGDWRDRIAWPDEVSTDLNARSRFYVGLGFDPTLTDFPAPAFQESADLAGLRREPPPIVQAYGPPIPDTSDEEHVWERTNLAHDWLMRLETNLRRFIDQHMTRAFGPDWPRHRLPNGFHDRWKEKQAKAVKAGRGEWPLIAYADFTEYEQIICRADNWRELFANFFGRPESVRESFQRLYMIRIDTMHARPIGQDDELLLYVEIRRLCSAMRLG